MINLLPKQYKQDIRFGKISFTLQKLLASLLIACLGLVIIVWGCIYYIKQDIHAYSKTVEELNLNLSNKNESSIMKQLSDINSQFLLVSEVLSQEVVFSKLLPHIGSLMPDGSYLNGLSLSRDTDGGIDLTISAKDYSTASQALVNLQSNESLIFQKADANSVTCDYQQANKYPCSVSIRVLFTQDNPFLFINQKGLYDEQ